MTYNSVYPAYSKHKKKSYLGSKAQSASSAAAFIAVLTVIIILYILFLPPDVREEILHDGTGSGGSSNGSGGTGSFETTELFRQQIGRIDYVRDNDKIYDLSSVRIYSPTSGQILKVSPSIAVRNGLFDKENSAIDIEFEIDRRSTDNVLLSFSVKESVGPVRIHLNGRQIYSGTFNTANPKPIPIAKDDLENKNILTFKSMDPGWIFWRANKLTVENMQITGDVTDYSRSQSIQYFSVSEAEKNNLKSIRFFFLPTCNLNEVGLLDINLNNRIIYSAIADCGVRNIATLDSSNIRSGSNEIKISTDKGSYLMDNMYMQATFEKPMYDTYFFDMGKDYFLTTTERSRCGDIDGECPPGCSETIDADCCFKNNAYWCGLPTRNPNDRCVYYVDANDCDVCPTGHYNRYFNVHKNCEKTCGDNKDKTCPSSCPGQEQYYDADCCYKANSYNYFCQEVPITGLIDKCKASVRASDCNLCPSGYKDKNGRRPDACSSTTTQPKYYDDELIWDYDVELIVRFVDDISRKRVDININGYKISIDTTKIEYTRIIDDYVRTGTNTIEIIPVQDLTIAEITVKLIRVR